PSIGKPVETPHYSVGAVTDEDFLMRIAHPLDLQPSRRSMRFFSLYRVLHKGNHSLRIGSVACGIGITKPLRDAITNPNMHAPFHRLSYQRTKGFIARPTIEPGCNNDDFLFC